MSDADPRDYRSLGDLLRDAREEKQVSFEQLNESTKISVRVLKALEQDDLEAASGVIYVRGFVRTLAGFYDLDPEWLGAKLDALADETSRPVLPVEDDDDVIAGPVADPVSEEPPAETGPKWEVESTRIRHVGASSSPRVPRNLIYGLVAVLVLVIALVGLIGRDSGTDGGSAENASTARTETASLGEEPGPSVAENAFRPSSSEDPVDAEPDPVPEKMPEAATDEPAAAVTRTESVPTETGTAPAETRTGQARDDQPATSSGQTPDTAPTGLSSVFRPAEGEALPPMELRIIVDGPVEVTISSDGDNRKTRILKQGEDWRFRGSDHFTLAVTDPAVVRVEIDGRVHRLPVNWTGEEMALWRPDTDGGDR